MNLIKQIETSLKSIDQSRFQNLINHLLHLQGKKFISAPGAVVGKEKTSKGAPDSFFVDGDKYVFVECTTQERLGESKSFLKKLENDIDHCFNNKGTKISRKDIGQVILACNEKVSTEEFNTLKRKVQAYNHETSFEIFNIQNLPMQIYDFPGLSEQYLGVTIIKGEIHNLADFLTKTTKGLQPSLVNKFVGRENELEQSLSHLENVDVLLLTGAAGVGKSKLAISILEEFAKQHYIPIVIQSSAVPLWDDFVNLFQNGKNYIILFDDANKSVQNLTYLIDFIQKPKTTKLKVVITSRDYVKHHVVQRLENVRYRETVVEKLKDGVIEKIILDVLPNLNYYPDVRKKIVDLAKGNARVALMATYSVTPDAETNYLKNPVLLYEKYFEKVTAETEIFSKPIALQALAFVSFFGVLDKQNEEIALKLAEEFNVDWDELWTTILQLHDQEILDVYSDEVVKVSDQVLATYAFYKCFIDPESSVIDYAKWITGYIQSHTNRIKNTLIDVNNTFDYYHVKDLVNPHLQKIRLTVDDNELLYTFNSLFWFYQGYDTLIYIRQWIKDLPVEQVREELDFRYVHNDHTTPTKFFEILVNFWGYNNEFLRPAIELGVELVAKQPSRIPALLKFVNDYFSYRLEDLQYGYQRQNILLDVLLNESRSDLHQEIAGGIFLNISEKLFGWEFTEFGTTKGREFTYYNFSLYNSPKLLALRNSLLEGLYVLFESHTRQSEKLLEKIIHPGGQIDEQLYVAELPFYQKLVSDKFSPKQFTHCQFVKELVKKLKNSNCELPEEWNVFIHSDIMKIYGLFNADIEERRGKSWEQREQEKREQIQNYVSSRSWPEIESLIYSVDELYRQQDDSSRWSVESALSTLFIAIADRSKTEIEQSLKIFFSGELSSPLQTRVIYYLLNRKILLGQELIKLIEGCEAEEKRVYWIVSFMEALPEEQIDQVFLELLTKVFNESQVPLPLNRMLSFAKFDNAFQRFKQAHPEMNFGKHNIISYLTNVLLNKENQQWVSWGFHFCQECGEYFADHVHLLKRAYLYLRNRDRHFDYDGKEFEVVLKFDNNFFIEFVESKIADSAYLSSVDFEDLHVDYIWSSPNYEEIICKALNTIIDKSPFCDSWGHPSEELFAIKTLNDDLQFKVETFITNYIAKFHGEPIRIRVILNVVLHKFPNWFLTLLQQALLLNKDVEFLKRIYFSVGGVYTGSRVPRIQTEIDLCSEVIAMIKRLPDVLDYVDHVKYMEQKIGWLKKEIKDEQRREFWESMD